MMRSRSVRVALAIGLLAVAGQATAQTVAIDQVWGWVQDNLQKLYSASGLCRICNREAGAAPQARIVGAVPVFRLNRQAQATGLDGIINVYQFSASDDGRYCAKNITQDRIKKVHYDPKTRLIEGIEFEKRYVNVDTESLYQNLDKDEELFLADLVRRNRTLIYTSLTCGSGNISYLDAVWRVDSLSVDARP